MKDFICLGFEKVPYRPEGYYVGYSGPSEEDLITKEVATKTNEYIKKLNADELIKLVDDDRVSYMIVSAVACANPSNSNELAFIYKMGNAIIQRKEFLVPIAEAALRMNDEQMFEAVISNLYQYRLGKLPSRAIDIGQKGEPYLAFRLLYAASHRTSYKDLTILNDAIFFLIQVTNNTGISPRQLSALLKKAFQKGPKKPSIFHNLARVYIKLNNYDMALECIRAAVYARYNGVDKLKNDPALDPIKSDSRFRSAFEVNEN